LREVAPDRESVLLSPLLHGHDPHGRVAWQSTFDEENSLARWAARRSRGRSPRAGRDISEARADAQSKGQQLVVETVSDAPNLDAAFAALAQQRVGGMLVQSDPFFTSSRVALVELAARYGIPAIYARHEIADAGGLITYGWRLGNSYWLQGVYAGRILKGEKPAEMPIIRPTKFDLVINLVTAKALAIHVPDRLLVLADKVIE
jgi:putative tryptophan/tyrosine transport system substrate-binding protein